MTTAQDQQSRAAYEDRKWYWVEHEGWHDEPPTIAPALYKAECDAWYSIVFSGISTRFLKVLEPCELRAARALPARGVDPMLDTPAGPWKCGNEFLPYHPDASHVSPEYRAGWNDCYTAAQVQAMGRVPPGWQAVPVGSTAAMEFAFRRADTTYLGAGGRIVPKDPSAAFRAQYAALLAAAPRPPAAQEGKTVACACGDEFPIDSYGGGFLDAKGKCFGCDAADEAAHGIKEGGSNGAEPG